LKQFFSPAVRAELKSYDAIAEMESMLPRDYLRWSSLAQAQYLEAMFLLPGYLLSSQGDRMAMAHSVEGRYPFLDSRVVEFASRLAPTLKIKVLKEKYILKRCLGDLVPASVKNRSKQPYRAPEGRSFFSGERHEYVDALLSPQRIREDGIFDPLAVEKLSAKVRSGRAIGIKDNMALVGILSTGLLIEQFMKGPRTEPAYVND
jgi:asparagine synthase (glutamine-hydrolysing)